MSFSRGDYHAERAHEFFRLGRTCVQTGDVAEGRRYLLKAVEYDKEHSEAWVWLSATTIDPAEQRQYLEWAIAANPSNAAAKRGLGILLGKIQKEDLVPPGVTVAPRQPTAPEKAEVQRTFACPQCGGTLRFDPQLVDLKCQYCGHVEVVAEEYLSDHHDQILDYSLGTRQAQRWAEAARIFVCEKCSASTVLPTGQTSSQCPYCGSPALVAAPEEKELLPIDALIPMGFDAAKAHKVLQKWLGRGLFAPDDLAVLTRKSRVQPTYVPYWIFDASLTVRWHAQVEEERLGRKTEWVWRTGERTFLFANQVVPATRALPADLLRRVDNFNLKRLIVFKPEYLAGWPAGLYNVSLTDASLLAREKMVKEAEKELLYKVAPGKGVIDLTVSPGELSGQTYKLVFLPFWVGTYHYQQRTYRILINAQTGQIAGDKPTDRFKIVVVVIMGLILLGVALTVFWVIARQQGWF